MIPHGGSFDEEPVQDRCSRSLKCADCSAKHRTRHFSGSTKATLRTALTSCGWPLSELRTAAPGQTCVGALAGSRQGMSSSQPMYERTRSGTRYPLRSHL